MSEARQHFWISNPAFTSMTGVRWVCMDCGLGAARRNEPAAKAACPGRRQEAPR